MAGSTGFIAFTNILLAMVGLSVATPRALAEKPEVYFVPDVVGQFNALMERADALGFGRGSSPDPSMCKHYQGIARAHDPGTPYFFVTRSGIHTASCSLDNDYPANLLIVQMASRNTSGERLRSNRLQRNTETDDSAPPPGDTTVAFVSFDGTGGWPNYGHAGGVQLVGDILAVPLESPYAGGPSSQILFIDVSNPLVPVPTSFVVPVSGIQGVDDISAGVVAVTPRPSGHYLMLVTGGDNSVVHVYESNGTNLAATDLTWTLLDIWTEADDEDDLGGGHNWPTNPSPQVPVDFPHQALNFVREGGPDGQLYLLGSRNKGGGSGGPTLDEDKIDLYRVEWEGNDFKLRWVTTKEITAKGTSSTFHDANEPDDVANLAAAGGFYVSPTGELIFYATEHDNDGPNATIKAGEWRHRDMVRPSSPTYDPTPVVGGPYSVPEGGSIDLNGHGEPAVTKAWIEFYADPDFTDRSVPIDYEDWHLDDFDDFRKLDDGDFVTGFSDQASSWRWFAPVGCTIRADDDDFLDNNFPGDHTRTLAGTGIVQSASDLHNVNNDAVTGNMNDRLTSAEFFSDCDAYYQSSIIVSWDLDGDSVYETTGETVSFSAASLDGPSTAVASMQAQHPIDGRAQKLTVEVKVTNVPPVIGLIEALDSLGLVVGVDVPVAVVGLPVTLHATFTDAGIPDTQMAGIEWGDSAVATSDTFDHFSDAFGGVVGEIEHAHTYTTPDIYTINLKVTDDDLGLASTSSQVEIASLADAAQSVADDLELLLAQQQSDPAVHAQLENALNTLTGGNGAIARFNEDNVGQGINRARHALLMLEQVEDDVDLGSAPLLLVQVCKAGAVLQIEDAKTTASTSSEFQRIATAEALVASGDALVASGQLFEAASSYFHAHQRVSA